MSYTYSDYCRTMRNQGKRPVSEEEFNLKKEELRYSAEDSRDLSEATKNKADSAESGFMKGLYTFISALSKAVANQMDKYGK